MESTLVNDPLMIISMQRDIEPKGLNLNLTLLEDLYDVGCQNFTNTAYNSIGGLTYDFTAPPSSV